MISKPRLTSETIGIAMSRIAAWRSDVETPVACPHCQATGIAIVDRSTRPYAEWYALRCPSCGLDETVHIPLGPAVIGGID